MPVTQLINSHFKQALTLDSSQKMPVISMHVLSVYTNSNSVGKTYYSGTLISRTSKGNKNWFEKSGVRNIGGKITVTQIQGKRLLV